MSKTEASNQADLFDTLLVGRQIRFARTCAGLTLDDLSAKVGRSAPFLSQLENGKKEVSLSLLNQLAGALSVPARDLLDSSPPTRRDELEIAVELAQRDPLYQGFGLARFKPSAKIPDIALEHIVRLYDELRGRSIPNIVTREE
ncbi:MAG: helix-turn-helix domain-containing protein, partial [Acidobacteria bacterium]|nr:helix-turn-helix domain-containing protein [Acidobacteriota bacterium]